MESLQPLTRKDVFILGAGFSKAVNELFPLAAELLGPIEDALGQDLTSGVRRKGGEGFEQWLSRLAEDQPYLSPDNNLERSVAFLRVSQKIGEILTERENEALKCPIPDWLAKLIFAWHIRQATVISFNYDNVVEAAVQSQCLPMYFAGYLDGYPVRTHDILNRLPPLPPARVYEETSVPTFQNGGRWDVSRDYLAQPSPTNTFRLFKLHGSISWYWVSDDLTGVTLQRWPDIGKFGDPMGDRRAEIARQLPGRVPFIAPPSSTKSKYLGNPVIRKLWQDAFQGLQKAEHIYFLGYSVPPQDLAAMGLIIEGIGDRTPQIHVIDVRPDLVRANLVRLLTSDSSAVPGQKGQDIRNNESSDLKNSDGLECLSDNHPVKDFAERYFNELSEEGATNLVRVAASLNPITLEDLAKLWSGPDDSADFPITGSVICPGLPIKGFAPSLNCDQASVDGDTLIVPVTGGGDTDARQLTKLMRLLQESAGIKTIVVSHIDGTRIPVVPFILRPRETPHLTGGNWHDLFLAPLSTK